MLVLLILQVSQFPCPRSYPSSPDLFSSMMNREDCEWYLSSPSIDCVTLSYRLYFSINTSEVRFCSVSIARTHKLIHDCHSIMIATPCHALSVPREDMTVSRKAGS